MEEEMMLKTTRTDGRLWIGCSRGSWGLEGLGKEQGRG